MKELYLQREEIKKCFGCGKENPIGLKLTFHYTENHAEAEFIPQEFHQGWPDIVHGGIVCSVLDEALGYATYSQGVDCVTAKMEVRFRQLVRIGEPLRVVATIVKKTRRLIEAKATLFMKDETIAAEGNAVMWIVGVKDGTDSGTG